MTILFGSPNGTNKFPKYHVTSWFGVNSFIPMVSSSPNTVVQYRHVIILQDPSWSVISPDSQKFINTTSNGVSESIVWSIWCSLWDHEFSYWQFVQDLMNWYTSLLTIGFQNHFSILDKVLCEWICPDRIDIWYADIATCLNLTETNISLSCLNLSICGVF